MPVRNLSWSLAIVFLHGVVGAQQFDLRTYSLEDGLPGATVNAFCEDGDGYLWIATDNGVARTDGLDLRSITGETGKLGEITAIHCDSVGGIWLGGADGSLFHWDRKDLSRVHSDHDRGAVSAIISDHDGALWIVLSNGIVRHGPLEDPLHFIPVPNSSILNAAAIDRNGALLIGSDEGLFTLENEKWRKIPIGDSAIVLSLFADEHGVIAGTSNGIVELDRDLQVLPPGESKAGFFPLVLPDPRVQAVLRANNGDIWMGTPAGLARLSDRGGTPQLRTIGERNGLGNDMVKCLYEDRSGGIWCGTHFGGMSRYTSDAFMHFTERDGLASKIVSAIHRTPDGTLWLATLGGGVTSWNGDRSVTFGKAEGLGDPFVTSLTEDEEGYLLAATADDGIFRWNGRSFDRAFEFRITAGLRISTLQRDQLGRTWIGHEEGVRIVHENGISDPSIDAHVLDIVVSTDTTWIASAEGLFACIDHDNGMEVIPFQPLIGKTLLSLERDNSGNLWIGTDGHGLLRVNGSRIDSVTARHNSMGGAITLSGNTVKSVLLDAYQNVWVATRSGVDALELDVLQEMMIGVHHYTAEDGPIGIGTLHNATMLDADSTLWFGTLRGATRYDPHAVEEIRSPPEIHLTGMQLFFEDVDWGPWSDSISDQGIPIGLRLPPGKDHLTFEFTGISLAQPEKVRYRYMLEGYDRDWSPITTERKVIYSNLPPGEHTFKVLAQNASGVWTEQPLEYGFIIVAPLWRRPWVQAGSFALLVFVILGTLRWREIRAKRIQRRLETMVTDRTQELAQEQQRSDALLLNILPRSTAEELKRKGTASTRSYERCSVLFSDFAGFTERSGTMDGHELVADLDHYFRLFDRISGEFGMEKIKTIGDAYMCAGGIPEPRPTHALDAVLAAFGMLHQVEKSNAARRTLGKKEWTIRIGIHSGPVIAGVVGEKKFAYDIWGNTVNLASRMESNSTPGRTNISGATYAQVMDFIEAVPRGPIKVRGKGELHMYFALRLRPQYSADQDGLLPNEKLLQLRSEMLSALVV